jgi:hypothetical protein
MLKKAAQQGRSKRRGDAYSVQYGEPLSEARTPLAGFFSILLGSLEISRPAWAETSMESRGDSGLIAGSA